jgi:hypothetical protein
MRNSDRMATDRNYEGGWHAENLRLLGLGKHKNASLNTEQQSKKKSRQLTKTKRKQNRGS